MPDDFDDAIAAYVNADYEKAYQLWRPLAEEGDGSAMFDLGILYWDGKGIPRNRSLAVDWWKKSAEENVAAAQYNLGLAYYLGAEIDQDVESALSLIRLSANQGHGLAINILPLIEQEFLRLSETETDKPLEAYTGANIGETTAKLYTGPSFENEVLETLDVGSPILVLKSENEWSRVAIPDGIRLWVYGSYVMSNENTSQVTGTGVRVRTKPTTDSSSVIVGTLPIGTVVDVTGAQKGWNQIRTPSAISAWIPNRHLRFASAADNSWQKEWEKLSILRETQSLKEINTGPEIPTPKTLPQPTIAPNTQAAIQDPSNEQGIPIDTPQFKSATVSSTFSEVVDSPSKSAQLLKLLAKDAPVQIVEEKDLWARVLVPTGLYVWVYGEYLTEDSGRWFVNTDHVRARSQPSTDPNSVVLGIFSKNSDVTFISRQGDWKRVKSAGSVTGWMLIDQLTIHNSQTKN